MAKEKQKWPFCEQGYSHNDLQHGRSITVGRLWLYRGEKADFKPFLNVPIKELEQRLKSSQAEEKKVFEAMKKAVEAWDEHGAQTLLLLKAIEYLKVPVVTHTSNEWKKRKDGSWEISNLVYKMTFSITRSGMEWKLVWEVSYMAPSLQVGYRGYERTPRERIDYEGSKKYKTLDGAQRYMQMKFDQYASYFKELSPPVPIEAKDLFCVNGQLLQGYTLARPMAKKKEVTVADLLDCLDDGDIHPPKAMAPSETPTVATPSEKPPAPKVIAGAKKEVAPKANPLKISAAKKKPPHKKRSAPVR